MGAYRIPSHSDLRQIERLMARLEKYLRSADALNQERVDYDVAVVRLQNEAEGNGDKLSRFDAFFVLTWAKWMYWDSWYEERYWSAKQSKRVAWAESEFGFGTVEARRWLGAVNAHGLACYRASGG